MSVEVLEDGRKRISAPLSDDDVRALEIGDVVLVNRTVYAAPTDEWAVKNGGG